MSLSGSPSELQAFSQTWCPVTDKLKEKLRLFVAPTAPNRLKLKCMRDGGPLSATNRNSECQK
jgi:hypothetical protein